MKKAYILISFALLISLNIVSSQSCLPNGITFSTQSEIDNFQINYPNCNEVEGYVSIRGEDIVNLNGLGSLTTVGNYLSIFDNPSLTTLSGLESLTTIYGGLSIEQNDLITNLSGLANLTSVGEWVVIVSNGVLKDLNGLEGLISIGNTLEIRLNDSLTSLSGIDNIDYSTISQLVLLNNSLLSECEIKSICDYLSFTNNSSDYIQENATECNSELEILEACEASDLDEININSEFTIYPNPATDKLIIKISNGLKIEMLNIYNQLGQKVFHKNEPIEEIDISKLGKGTYILELTSSELKVSRKLIIKE